MKDRSRTRKILRPALAAGMLAAFLPGSSRAGADLLDDWNEAILQAIRRENTAPPLAARNLAIVHLAIRDAIDAGNSETPEAAANAAAYRTAFTLFPSQRASFDILWRSNAPNIGEGRGRDATIDFGGITLLEGRSADDAQLGVTYVPSIEPGAWRRTLPYFRPPELPHWGRTKPFAIQRCDEFRPAPPPALSSRQYAADLNEVKRYGARRSTARTAYDTETARFWSDFTGTVTPPGHWNQIARTIANNEQLGLRDKARLLALLNMAMADAGVVCWEAKYRFNFWRPVTAIRRAGEDGNAETEADPEWQPLLTTPPFPEYVSGHSTFSGAAGEILARFFKRDDLRFTVQSDSLPSVKRTYQSISFIVEEIGRSRVLGGIHFPSADRAGQVTGRAVGSYVFDSEKERRVASSSVAR